MNLNDKIFNWWVKRSIRKELERKPKKPSKFKKYYNNKKKEIIDNMPPWAFAVLAILAKVGFKIVGIIAKFGKLFKSFKLLGAVGSMAAYSWLFSWKFALLILVFLFVHESGHIKAMKDTGMKTKGIYFIPFLGGAAVADSMFKSREQEAYVGIMGPVAGLILIIPVFVMGFVMDNTSFFGMAAWMSLVNTFQFLPISPMDGGRILKSIFVSIKGAFARWFLVGGILLGVVLMIWLKIYLFAFLLPVGVLEYFGERRLKRKLKPMTRPQMIKYGLAYLGMISLMLYMLFYAQNIPGAQEALQVLAA